MSKPDLVPLGWLCLGPMRLQGRPVAARLLPDRAARYRTDDNCNMATETAIEAADDPSGNGRHGTMAMVGATGALAISDQLKLVGWAGAKWGV